MAKLDENGHEVLDDTPVALPIGFKRPPSINDTIRQLVRNELSRAAQQQGAESFEEADDFDVGDDYDPTSPWELTFDQELALANPPKMAEQRPIDGPATTPALTSEGAAVDPKKSEAAPSDSNT